MTETSNLLTAIQNLLFTTHQEIQQNGKTWLVVNGVALVEGVLNGYLVPMDEFGAFVQDWNDVSLVLRHPQQNNRSAKIPTPDVPRIGRFYGARLDEGSRRLAGEFWFDVNALLASADGQEIYRRIQANQMIEVSTGYFAYADNVQGVFDGQEYIGIHRQLHPDHIAVLPDQVGACSIADGCGLNRNSKLFQNCAACPANVPNQPKKENPMTELEKILEAIKNALEQGKRKFTLKSIPNAAGEVTTDIEVHDQVVANVDLTGINDAIESVGGMEKFQSLLKNLASLNGVFYMLSDLESIITDMGGVDAFKQKMGMLETVAPVANALAQTQADAEKATQAKRASLITTLTANAALGFTAEDLAGLEIPALEKLAAVNLSNLPAYPTQHTSYLGIAPANPAPVNNSGKELERPVFLLKKK